MGKKHIKVLWLDDMRDPVKYLKKKVTKDSGALYNNINFYNELMRKYDPEFTWVRTFEEFTDYIMQNGLPDLVSLDHDLGKGLKKGAECAHWLKQYCAENGLKLPKFYAHSANPNGRAEINATLSDNGGIVPLTEQDLRYMISSAVARLLQEDVFANRATIRGRKNKSVNLTYQRHTGYNKGNLTSADMLGTEKMEKNNEDTYKKKLKGGIWSYNITSIKGEEVMHFFKERYARERKAVTLRTGGVDYELGMEDNEFNEFMRIFNAKVNRVINYCIEQFRAENNEFEPTKVSIYPVPSREQFNQKMAEEMSKMTLGGLPVQVIDQNMLKKDLRNLQKDEDFINKNKEFFNGKLGKDSEEGGFGMPVMTHLEDDIRRLSAFNEAVKYVDVMNAAFNQIKSSWNNYKTNGSPRTLNTLASAYAKYYDAMKACTNLVSYKNFVRKGGEDANFKMDTIAKAIKYTKGPSVEGRSGKIWSLVEPILGKQISPSTGKEYGQVDINEWTPSKFQIKNLSNGERMGLKGYYNANEDAELVQRELERIKGGVFVIFDDNISGGATLGDICYQCKELGIQYIIPITFGEMAEKWTMNMIPLSRPTSDEGKYGEFNY